VLSRASRLRDEEDIFVSEKYPKTVTGKVSKSGPFCHLYPPGTIHSNIRCHSSRGSRSVAGAGDEQTPARPARRAQPKRSRRRPPPGTRARIRMALKFDDACSMTVEEVRSDKSELNWVALKYEGKSKIMVGGKGTGGYVRPCARPSCSVECPRELTLTPCPRARRFHGLPPRPWRRGRWRSTSGAAPTPFAAPRARIWPPTAGRRVLPGARVHARRAAAFRGDGHACLMMRTLSPSPSLRPLLLACAWRCAWRFAGLQSSRPMYPPTSARGTCRGMRTRPCELKRCFWKMKYFFTKILGHRERVCVRWQDLTLYCIRVSSPCEVLV
jgi:hypothetical protein